MSYYFPEGTHSEAQLIPVTKNGEVLEVHPSCLAAHLVAGWTVSSASLPVSETKPASSTTRRGQQPRQSITE